MSVESTIPVVHLPDYTEDDPAARVGFIDTLGAGLERFGFVAVTGHGIPAHTLNDAYSLARQLFALPPEVKARYETPEDGRQRGYTSFGVEHAKDQEVGDLKEFWHVGRALGSQHPLTLSGKIPKNRFPDELPAFGPVFTSLFIELESFAELLLDALGEYLSLRPGLFHSLTKDGNSVLRVIHYPDLPGSAVPGAVRAAAHEDINLITILPAATQPGLELLTRDGEWMPVNTPPDVMICDTGDMMALLTGGRLPATTHRVVNPNDQDGGRLSMPFFMHPHPDRLLRPLHRKDIEPVVASEFLKQRLRDIGVM